jgi:hypothetical protein
MNEFSHLDPRGQSRMVDISGKPASGREAVAREPSDAVECLGFVAGAVPHCVEVLQEAPTSY